MEQSLLAKLWIYIQSKSTWVGFALVVLVPGAVLVLAVNFLGTGEALSPQEEAERYESAGNFERAEQKYLDLLVRDSGNIEIHRRYIQSHFAQPKVKGKNHYRDDKKIMHYYTQLVISPERTQRDIAQYGLGLVESHLDHSEKAIEHFALIENKNMPYYNNSFGFCMLKMGKRLEAEELFRREIELGGNRDGAVSNLAGLYLELKQYDKISALMTDTQLRAFVPRNAQRIALLSRHEYDNYAGELLTHIFSRTTFDGFIASFAILLIWSVYFIKIDIFEPEQFRFLVMTLVLGMISAFLCSVLYDGFNYALNFRLDGTIVNDLLYCIFAIGLIEEAVKILPVIILLRATRLINEPIDFLVYAAISALGFAFMENMLYFQPTGVSTISGRAFTAVVGHMAMSSLAAYGLLLSAGREGHPGKRGSFLLFFSIAVLVHGVYDFMLSGRGAMEYLAPFSIFLLLYLFFVYGRMLNNALNISTFFAEHEIQKLQNVGRILTYALSYVLLLQYLIVSIRYGAENANLSVARSMLGSIGLIFIITSSLGRFKLQKDKLMPLFEKSKKHKK